MDNVTVLKKQEPRIVFEKEIYTKIVIEDGVDFMHKLRAEAERQKAIKIGDLSFAALDIEEVPIVYSDAEMGRLADSFEVTEGDD